MTFIVTVAMYVVRVHNKRLIKKKIKKKNKYNALATSMGNFLFSNFDILLGNPQHTHTYIHTGSSFNCNALIPYSKFTWLFFFFANYFISAFRIISFNINMKKKWSRIRRYICTWHMSNSFSCVHFIFFIPIHRHLSTTVQKKNIYNAVLHLLLSTYEMFLFSLL